MTALYSISDAKQALQKYWKYPNFRHTQREVIQCLSQRRSVLALMPTGGGKSICYQVPALVMPGLTLVVSPLISLMEDQVAALKRLDIKAEAIHSGHSYRNIDRIMDNCVYGNIRLLYVAPERLHHYVFRERISKIDIAMVAIDEAHCISQWGHNFRPSYLQIGEFLNDIKPQKILALTATATSKVMSEILKSLDIEDATVIRDSFERTNIQIYVKKSNDKINDIVKESISKKTIIYARNRRMVKTLATSLNSHEISARHYHAGLVFKQKKLTQEQFITNELSAVVATNAFGMGIDVEDVRQVIHYSPPPSIEEYYQEIGRAGRDGLPAKAILFLSKSDISNAESRLNKSYPEFKILKKHYKAIHVFYNVNLHEGQGKIYEVDLEKMSNIIKIKYNALFHSLQAWHKLGVWELINDDHYRLFVKAQDTPKGLREAKQDSNEYRILEYWMRNYDNFFNGWIQIDINKDLKKLELSEEKYLSILKSLSHKSLINYFKQPSGQKLTILQPRVPFQYLDEFEQKYKYLKELEFQRWQSVKSFLSTDRCRMQLILEYFDEEKNTTCGTCDICQRMDNVKDNLLIQRKMDEERG